MTEFDPKEMGKLLDLSEAHSRAERALVGPGSNKSVPLARKGRASRVLAFFWGPTRATRRWARETVERCFEGAEVEVRYVNRADERNLALVVKHRVIEPACVIGLNDKGAMVARISMRLSDA